MKKKTLYIICIVILVILSLTYCYIKPIYLPVTGAQSIRFALALDRQAKSPCDIENKADIEYFIKKFNRLPKYRTNTYFTESHTDSVYIQYDGFLYEIDIKDTYGYDKNALVAITKTTKDQDNVIKIISAHFCYINYNDIYALLTNPNAE